MQKRIFAPILFISLISSSSWALSPAFEAPRAGHLFSEYSPVVVELKGPLTSLIRDSRAAGLKKVSARGLLILNQAGEQKAFPMSFHLKGNSSKSCPLPKFEIKFDKDTTENTLFAGTRSVDLHTHCQELKDIDYSNRPPGYKEFVIGLNNNHREALLYHWMNLLNAPSFRSRPVFVKYIDTDVPSELEVDRQKTYQAFFLEDSSDLRKRLNLVEIRGTNDRRRPDPKKPEEKKKSVRYEFDNAQGSALLDKEDLGRSMLLQILFGNQDWYLQLIPSNPKEMVPLKLWNLRVFETVDTRWVVFPQDFDGSRASRGVAELVVSERNGQEPLEYFRSLSEESRQKIIQSLLERLHLLEPSLSSLSSQDPQGAEALHQRIQAFRVLLESL